MFRIAFSTITILLSMGTALLASPEEDAAYIALQHIDENIVQSFRPVIGPAVVNAYRPVLREIGGTITDSERFIAMLPESTFDDVLPRYQQNIADIYIERFTAQQLNEIAALYRTDLGQKIFAELMRGLPVLREDEAALLLPFEAFEIDTGALSDRLTAADVTTYTAFFESETGVALKENQLLLQTGPAIMLVRMTIQTQQLKPQLNTASMVNILEANGIVTFSNRILKKDAIAMLRAAIP